MLTIKRDKNSLDKITIEKESVKIFLQGTLLKYLTHTDDTTTNTTTTFQEILDQLGIKKEHNDDSSDSDWKTFKELMNKKTMFYESSIVQNYNDAIDVVSQYVPESMVMNRLKQDVIRKNIPRIVSDLNMEHIYEQLIFYEYIYMSETTSYVSKLRIMIKNKYIHLLKMLDNGEVDICTTARTNEDDTDEDNPLESSSVDLKSLFLLHFHDQDARLMIKMFVDLHSNWLGVNPGDLMEQCAIILNDQTQQDIAHYHSDVKSVLPSDVITRGIVASDLCLLNTLYQINPLRVRIIIEQLIPIFNTDFFKLPKSYDEQILHYLGLDLIVRMMEDDSICLTNFSCKKQAKLLSLWMRMSSPGYRCFSRSHPYPYKHYDAKLDKAHPDNNLVNIREIALSPTIVSALKESFLTFGEFGYILSTDRLDMFEILCRNLAFKTIHPILIAYMPPKILSYCIEKSQNINNNTILESPGHVTLNIYELSERSQQDFKSVLHLIKKTFNGKIQMNYSSIINKYNFVECTYIVLYWEYLDIIESYPTLCANLVELFNNEAQLLLTDTDLDICLFIIALKNSKFHEYEKILLSRYVNMFKQNEIMFLTGPNFEEIRKELEKYEVSDLKSLDELCKIQNRIMKDRCQDDYIDKYIKSSKYKSFGSQNRRKIDNLDEDDDDIIEEENDDSSEEEDSEDDKEDSENQSDIEDAD